MVQQADVSNHWLTNARDQSLSKYRAKDLHEKYHFQNPEVFMTTQWLNNAHAKHIVNKMLREWVALGKTFRYSSKDGYKASIFLKHIQSLNPPYILTLQRKGCDNT